LLDTSSKQSFFGISNQTSGGGLTTNAFDIKKKFINSFADSNSNLPSISPIQLNQTSASFGD
jgi:hypothetical protein